MGKEEAFGKQWNDRASLNRVHDMSSMFVFDPTDTLKSLKPRAMIFNLESHDKLTSFAEAYITHLETAETDKVCLCFWRIHPDDVELETKRRKVLVDEHPECPVHTKAGRLVGFINWLTSANSNHDPACGCDDCLGK